MIKCNNNVCENRINGICHRIELPEISWCGASIAQNRRKPNGPAQVAWLCDRDKCLHFIALKPVNGYCNLNEITKETHVGCIFYRQK